MAETRARFPWGLTVATGIALVLLCGLGTWQVQRLHWKEGLIAEAEAVNRRPFDPATAPVLKHYGRVVPNDVVATQAPARAMDPPFEEFQRVLVECDFHDTRHGIVELQSIHDGQAGVRLISECGGYLVDLGFVPDVISARPAQTAYPERRPFGSFPAIIAQARSVPKPSAFAPPPSNGRFFARDTKALANALASGAVTQERTLFAETSAFPEWPALQPSAPPAAFSNNHLGYALTWFGLALALAGTYVALLRRQIGAQTSEKSSS